jgi:hypothetical protein
MQSPAKHLRSLSGSLFLTAAVSVLWIPVSTGAMAQTSDVSPSKVAPVIPQQVRYMGAFANRGGDTVEATFRIYATAEGGEALWTETHQVAVKADGSYSVLLGAASESGLPQAVFAGGQARWLGVSIDSAEALPRTALSSVAYAMKAGDAETVGGVAAGNLVTKDELAKMSQTSTTAVQAQTAVQSGIEPATNPTGSGTADYVALWTTSGNLGNSNIFQASSGFLGVGTTTPGGPLQLSTGATGGANATMMLTQTSAASGNYYADIGLYNSKGLIGNLSALGAGYPAGNLFVANDVVFLGGQQNAGTNLIFLTNTSGALKFGTGGFAVSNERMRIGAAGGVSVGNSYVGTDPGAGNLIVSGKVGVGTTAPTAVLEVNGTAKFDGLVTFASGQTFPGGGGTITGVTASSPLTGGGTSGAVTVGLSTSALETTLNGVYAQLSAANTFTGYTTFNGGGVTSTAATGASFAAMNGVGTNGSTGVYGSSDTGSGIKGVSTSGTGVVGTSTSGSAGSFNNSSVGRGTVVAINSANYNDGSTLPTALSGVSNGTSSVGTYGEGTEYGVWGFTNTSYSTAVFGNAAGGDSNSVTGQSGGDGSVGVYGYSGGGFDTKNQVSAIGVSGFALTGIGVLGVSGSASDTSEFFLADTPGLWGDTSGNGESTSSVGILATADDAHAGEFVNDSASLSTIYVDNFSGSGSTGLFKVFKASTPLGTCGIGDGDLSCTGQVKTLATTSGGSRTVETYSTQSAENWMEDYGTGSLSGGVGVVKIDATFADTVTADASYHVFLTPHGDSKGLYVTNLTPSSFEVRESGGGTSSLRFDYKIVGKRRGYEAQRFVDVTDRFNAEQADTKRHMPNAKAARPSKVATQRGAILGPHMRPGGAANVSAPAVRASPSPQVKPVAKPM